MSFHQILEIEPGQELDRLTFILQEEQRIVSDIEDPKPVDFSKEFKTWEEALPNIIIDARVFGGILLPKDFFPGSSQTNIAEQDEESIDPWPGTFLSVPSHRLYPDFPSWRVVLEQGYCEYSGESNQRYSAIEELVDFMVKDYSLHDCVGKSIWMGMDWCIMKHDIGAAIDSLRLLHRVPQGFPCVSRILAEAFDSEFVGLRLAASDVFEFHPINSDPFITALTQLALCAPNKFQAQRPIKALRLIGGEDSFQALLSIVKDSLESGVKRLATVAIAWIRNLDDIENRLKTLVFQGDQETSKIASKAISTRKHHSITTDGGPLATREERESP